MLPAIKNNKYAILFRHTPYSVAGMADVAIPYLPITNEIASVVSLPRNDNRKNRVSKFFPTDKSCKYSIGLRLNEFGQKKYE
jgi:hypothetical protein